MRYLFKKPISYLATGAVALCVFIVVVVMTVMNGLVTDFKQKNHDFVGDCVVGTESLVGFAYYEDFIKILRKTNFIEGVSPVIKNYALINPVQTDRNVAVELMGIDPVKHSRVTGFAKTLYYHKKNPAKAFQPPYDPNLPGCIVGIDLWFRRDAANGYPKDVAPLRAPLTVTCFPLTSKGALAKAGAGDVNTKTFYYSDNSRSGLARVDSSLLYLPFDDAQRLCGMAGPDKRASAIFIKLKPNVRLRTAREKIANLWKQFIHQKANQSKAYLLQNVNVRTWKEYRRAFIAAMEKEQTMLIIMFSLVGLTTVFIVLVVFYMIVSHKSKDIGILKSVGASNQNVAQLFSTFALLVALCGSAVGTFSGWLFLTYINRIEAWLFQHFHFQLWDRTIYAIGDIPNKIDLKVLAIIVGAAIIVCWLGALIPSRQAAKLNPVEILQVNQL